MKHLSRVAVVAALRRDHVRLRVTLGSPDIADLQDHPGRYPDHTVTRERRRHQLMGRSAALPFRFYKVDDGTGELTVVSGQRAHAGPRRSTFASEARCGDVAACSAGAQSDCTSASTGTLHVQR